MFWIKNFLEQKCFGQDFLGKNVLDLTFFNKNNDNDNNQNNNFNGLDTIEINLVTYI